MPKEAFQATSEQRRRDVLLAAAAEFADFGYKGANVNRIAAKAGIGKGSIYFFFENKEDLFLTTIAEGIKQVEIIFDELLKVVKKDGFFAMIRKSINFAQDFYESHPDLYRLYCNYYYGGQKEFYEELKDIYRNLVEYKIPALIEAGIKRGDLRNDLKPAILGFFYYFNTMRFQDTLNIPEISPELRLNNSAEDLIEQFIEVLKKGIGNG